MERIHQRVAGIDLSRDFLDVHLRMFDPGTGKIQRERKRFSSMTKGLTECGDWLTEHGIELVVMEATGIYWRAPFKVLESLIDHVWVLNAHHVKNVPGRKTDMADAEWLADVAAHGMVRPSFVPPAPVRELRELTRFRASTVHNRTQAIARIEKMLQDAGVKISSVASNVLGVGTREMFEKLIAGERDPAVLAQCARGTMRRKIAELTDALAGNFGDHHAVAMRALLDQIDLFEAQIEQLDAEIARRLEDHGDVVELVSSVPGLSGKVASAVIGEIGLDMSKFPTPGHLSAFAGLAPASAESGGKSRRTGTRKAGPHLKTVMVRAAWSAVRVKDSFLGAMFQRVRARRGAKIAIVAVARKLLEAIWHVLSTSKPFADLGRNYHDERRSNETRTRRLVEQLESLGHTVTLNPAGAAEPA